MRAVLAALFLALTLSGCADLGVVTTLAVCAVNSAECN